MKKALFLILAVLFVLPLMASCQDSNSTPGKYGTYETAVKVTGQIPNPDYVAPTESLPEGEEPEENLENPEFYFDGTVDLYVDPKTVDLIDAVKAVAGLVKDRWTITVDDTNTVTIGDRAFRAKPFAGWVFDLNTQQDVSPTTNVKAGDKILVYWVDEGAAPAQTAETAEAE